MPKYYILYGGGRLQASFRKSVQDVEKVKMATLRVQWKFPCTDRHYCGCNLNYYYFNRIRKTRRDIPPNEWMVVCGDQ